MNPTIDQIKRATSEHYGVANVMLMSSNRQRKVARPRQVAMYLSRRLTTRSLPEIGRLFRRDHTTVIHAMRRITALMEADPAFSLDVATVCARAQEVGAASWAVQFKVELEACVAVSLFLTGLGEQR